MASKPHSRRPSPPQSPAPRASLDQRKARPTGASPIYYRGILYSLNDNGVLVALDAKTGKEIYRQRLGGNCNSSPIAANGLLYFSNNDGATFVVKAGRQFQIVATNHLNERITAPPAIAGNDLIYRTDSHIYCITTERTKARN